MVKSNASKSRAAGPSPLALPLLLKDAGPRGEIAPQILEHYPDLNTDQRNVVAHDEGPLLVVAGPGSGKTYSIVLRAINLLLRGKALPQEIVLCTFTEKAAFEMRDRLAAAAQKVGYSGDLSELRVSTIHSFCNDIITRHRHRTHLGNNYETLDDLTQKLFVFEHFDEIIGASDENGLYLTRWKSKWGAIQGATSYFDKITEELIDVGALEASMQPFLNGIAAAYRSYERALATRNRVDFAHMQKIVHDLLGELDQRQALGNEVRYVLVDEYQDTNYIQEQLLIRLTETTRNLCVVGDEDQSLYRFRGATVRNILEFPQRFPGCRTVTLSTNYRSHRAIVERYDGWMASVDWSNRAGPQFRFDKRITAADGDHPEYPAVVSVWGQNRRDEARRIAELVKWLEANQIIQDYSQVALLLHSVRADHSGEYLSALERQGIGAFCPRARTYFDNPEVRLMVACFALIFGWYGDGRGEVSGSVAELAAYVDGALVDLAQSYAPPHALGETLRAWVAEIASLKEGEALDLRPADYFYRVLAHKPFSDALKNENAARNLATFSQLLNTFQNYYHYSLVTHRNRDFIRFHLFGSFIRLLHEGGINEYEDPDQPFPKGHVQVMTIHQAKGLEFPVVIVGSLSDELDSPKRIDRNLGPFYHRPPFEPEDRITLFDRMRRHYVAFSRPQKLLVLTTHEVPRPHFAAIWQGLPQWPYVERELLGAQRWALRQRMPLKRPYSFTGDLRIYETCPRQYQFFREFDFTPSRSAVIFFGLLVHQTIEEVHRLVLDGKAGELDELRIRDLFDRTFQFLLLSDVRPIDDVARAAAFRQVLNYVAQNRSDMARVIETEVDVSVEKEGYILTGKIDLLLGGDGKLELLDFKTSPRPTNSPELLAAYERQLCTYAHILERRHGKRVDRLMLYWTAEPNKADALMVFPYDPRRVEEAGQHFDHVVRAIQNDDFEIRVVPEAGICKECDVRWLCAAEGLIGQVD